MAKAKKLAQHMSSLRSMETSCDLTRAVVAIFVVAFVRDQGFGNATEESNFAVDVPVDGKTRRGWAAPLRKRAFTAGCDPKGFGPDHCEEAKRIKAIVDSLFKELQ